MIEYATPSSSIFESGAHALVNPVNTVGVMGAGLAKAFRERLPNECAPYFEACEEGRLRRMGSILPVRARKPNPAFPDLNWVIHLPTKRHWREPSRFDLIQDGIASLSSFLDLTEEFRDAPLDSIAIPALGCGLGQLPWIPVMEALEGILGGVRQRVIVFPPSHPVVMQRGRRFQLDA